MFKKIKELTIPALLAVGVFALTRLTFAADPGTITNGSGTSYAQFTETEVGAVNFAPGGNSISVGSSSLTGYAWGDYVGWINMNPTNGGVSNDGSGNLSGYAWGEITGWINFNPTNGGVTIDTSTGEFDGYAWSENFGWLQFSCPGTACVVTTWSPSSTPAEETPSGGGGGGGTVSQDTTTTTGEETTTTTEPIIPTVIPVTAPSSTPGLDNIYDPEKPRTFPRNLTFGSTGNDVQILQEFLIKNGYMEAGFNTGYFGGLTRTAVIAYQTAKGITPAVGFFGPITRTAVEGDMLAAAQALRPVPVQPTTQPTPTVQQPAKPFTPFQPFIQVPQKAVVNNYTNNLFGFPDVLSTVVKVVDKPIATPAEEVTPLVQIVPKIFQTVTNAISSFFSAFGR